MHVVRHIYTCKKEILSCLSPKMRRVHNIEKKVYTLFHILMKIQMGSLLKQRALSRVCMAIDVYRRRVDQDQIRGVNVRL